MTEESLPSPTRKETTRAWMRRHKMRARWEAMYPWIGGLVLGSACLFAKIDATMLTSIFKDVLPLAVSVASIFAGLQGALHAILLTMLQSRAVQRLKQEGLWEQLVSYVRLGITSLALFVSVAMVLIVLNAIGITPSWTRLTVGAIVALFSFSMLASLRIMLVEVKMLQVREPKSVADGTASAAA